MDALNRAECGMEWYTLCKHKKGALYVTEMWILCVFLKHKNKQWQRHELKGDKVNVDV